MDFFTENLNVSGSGSYWDGTSIVSKNDVAIVPEDQRRRKGGVKKEVDSRPTIRPAIPASLFLSEGPEDEKKRKLKAKQFHTTHSIISILVKVKAGVLLSLQESCILVRAFQKANPGVTTCGARYLSGIILDLDIGLGVDVETATRLSQGLSKPVFQATSQKYSLI